MMWFVSRRNTPAAAMSGRWSGSVLTLGLSALNAGTVFSSSGVSLSVELKPSFPEDSNGSPDYADRVDSEYLTFSCKIVKWYQKRGFEGC